MLYELFERCLNIRYFQSGKSANYQSEKQGKTLYIYFEESDGDNDWFINFDYKPIAYRENNKELFYAHGGFLKTWLEIEPFLHFEITAKSTESIIITGYSHGGAIAVLCHEYAYRIRKDIRNKIYGYGFGAPRVIFGKEKPIYSDIWKNFTVIRNIDDIVTHLPPKALGYINVGNLLEIGKTKRYTPIDAHRSENYLKELKGM